MEITGEVLVVLPTKGGVSQKGNEWALQQFVIREQKENPQTAVLEVFGKDKVNEFNIKQGETIKATFYINADEYQGKWYNRLRVFGVERVEAAPAGNNVVYQKPKKKEPEPEQTGNDGLPF